jgi:hypothetical protein
MLLKVCITTCRPCEDDIKNPPLLAELLLAKITLVPEWSDTLIDGMLQYWILIAFPTPLQNKIIVHKNFTN